MPFCKLVETLYVVLECLTRDNQLLSSPFCISCASVVNMPIGMIIFSDIYVAFYGQACFTILAPL